MMGLSVQSPLNGVLAGAALTLLAYCGEIVYLCRMRINRLRRQGHLLAHIRDVALVQNAQRTTRR